MRATFTLLFMLAATVAAHAQYQSAVVTNTQGDKVYIQVDPLLLRGDLDTLFTTTGDLQGQIDNLSWADVLVNGTTPGVDVNFFGYDAIGVGQVTTTGTFTGDSLVLNKDASIAGRMDVTGVVSLNDSLFVEGTVVLNDSLRVVQAVSMGSRLHVTGVTELGDSVHVVGNVNFDALLNVNGATTFGNTVDISGETTLGDTLHVHAPALFSDSLDVGGNANLGAQMTVDGATTLGSSLTVTGISTLGSALSVSGKAAFADSLIANSGADFNSTLNVDGATTLKGTTVDGYLDLNGNADISGTLDVVGATSLAAALYVTGVTTLSDTLNVVSAAMLGDSLRVGGNTRLTQDLWVDGNTNIGGTVNISGPTNLGGTLSVSGVTSLGDSLHVAGGADFDGDVNVDGGTTTGTLNVINTATFDGPSTFNDAAAFGDSIFVNAPATFSDTVVFTGGAHITGGLNLDKLVLNGVNIPALDNTDALPEGDSNLYFTADREAALQAQIDLQDSLNAVLTAVLDNLLNQLFDPAIVTTTAASPISAFTASINATFDAGGAEVEDSGFELSLNSDLSDSTVYTATGSGSLAEALSNLTKGTTYYYRAFVETIMGRANGAVQSFTTVDDAEISTLAANNIGATSANLRGQITSTGGGTISATDFQYGTNAALTGASLVSGSSTSGTFNGSVSGLSAGTTYYFRARATNEAGTVNGTTLNFATIGLASVTTGNSSNVGPTSATLSGSVTGNGGGTISSTGFQYSTSSSFSSPSTKPGSSTSGTFTASLTGLNASTTYYFRAYATNEAGTQYGATNNFTTATPDACNDENSVTYNGYNYQIVPISTQCWFAENLRTSTFKNGNNITELTGPAESYSAGRYVYADDADNLSTYGYLYNWFAVTDAAGLCPTGWHVPSITEWNTLITSVGGVDVAGDNLKTSSYSAWWNGSNSSGFSGIPGGLALSSTGQYMEVGFIASWWSTSPTANGLADRVAINYNTSAAIINGWVKTTGHSVRCVKDL